MERISRGTFLRRVGAGALVLAGSGIAGCASLTPPSLQTDGSRDRVRFFIAAQVMTAGAAPYAVAQEMGYFAEEGLDVEYGFIAGSTDVVKQVAVGSADMGAPSPEPVIIGRQPDQGLKLKYVYSQFRKNIYGMASFPETGITSLQSLKGKKIGVTSMGSAGVPMGKALLKAAGLDPETDATFVAVGEAAQAAAAIKNKQVDALSLWDTQYALVQTADPSIKYTMLPNDPIAKLPSNGIVVTEEYLQKYPKRVVGFSRAFAKASAFSLENPEAAFRIMWQRYPETRAATKDDATVVAEAMSIWNARKPQFDVSSLTVKKWGYNDPEGYTGMADFLFTQGMMKSKVNAEEVFTNQFIDEINKFDESKIRQQARDWKAKK